MSEDRWHSISIWAFGHGEQLALQVPTSLEDQLAQLALSAQLALQVLTSLEDLGRPGCLHRPSRPVGLTIRLPESTLRCSW